MGIIMPTAEQIYQLDGRIAVMKPATIKDDNLKHKAKLEEMLLADDVAGEEKIDGCHYKMYGCYFLSKDHNDKTANFPHLEKFFRDLGMPNLILDGEIYYPGKTSQFCTRVTGAGIDQAIAFQNQNGAIQYKAFDILRLPNGQWVVDRPYSERRKLLETLFRDYISVVPGMSDYVQIVQMTMVNKKEFLEHLLGTGAEGMVLKKVNSLYLFGKKPMWQWMKVKQHDSVDLFITGVKPAKVLYTGKNVENWPYWMHIDGMQRPVTKAHYNGWPGAFQMSAYVNGQEQVICYAAGLSEEIMESFTNNPNAYLRKVARIDFMEKTEDGYPRHPAFKELHEDKTPEECIYIFD